MVSIKHLLVHDAWVGGSIIDILHSFELLQRRSQSIEDAIETRDLILLQLWVFLELLGVVFWGELLGNVDINFVFVCDKTLAEVTQGTNEVVVVLAGLLVVQLGNIVDRAVVLSQDLSLNVLKIEFVKNF